MSATNVINVIGHCESSVGVEVCSSMLGISYHLIPFDLSPTLSTINLCLFFIRSPIIHITRRAKQYNWSSQLIDSLRLFAATASSQSSEKPWKMLISGAIVAWHKGSIVSQLGWQWALGNTLFFKYLLTISVLEGSKSSGLTQWRFWTGSTPCLACKPASHLDNGSTMSVADWIQICTFPFSYERRARKKAILLCSLCTRLDKTKE